MTEHTPALAPAAFATELRASLGRSGFVEPGPHPAGPPVRTARVLTGVDDVRRLAAETERGLDALVCVHEMPDGEASAAVIEECVDELARATLIHLPHLRQSDGARIVYVIGLGDSAFGWGEHLRSRVYAMTATYAVCLPRMRVNGIVQFATSPIEQRVSAAVQLVAIPADGPTGALYPPA